VADEQHDRNCPMRSSSPRNCAQHDSRRRGPAGAIAVKHSALAPKETLRRRTPRQARASYYLLNARTCSSRCELLTGALLTQEISAGIAGAVLSRNRLNLHVKTLAATRSGAREIDCPSFGKRLYWLPYRMLNANEFSAFPAIFRSKQGNAVHNVK
jgi:hypothetical protein